MPPALVAAFRATAVETHALTAAKGTGEGLRAEEQLNAVSGCLKEAVTLVSGCGSLKQH